MKNISLQKKLAAYSALVIPILALHHADAQLLYTDVIPDDTLYQYPCDTFNLDLNNDGIVDFRLGLKHHVFSYEREAVIAESAGINSVMGSVPPYTSYYSYATVSRLIFKLNSFDPIGFGYPWIKPQGIGTCSWDIMNEPHGEAILHDDYYAGFFWNDGAEGYAGLRIEVNNQTYYGWVRLVVDSGVHWMIVKDYAIDTIPDQNIVAGQGIPTGTEKIVSNELNIHPNPASGKIFISTNNQEDKNTQVSVFDLSGKKVLSQIISSGQNAIDVSTLTEGTYLLQFKNKNEVIVKKFEVQR